LRAALLTKGPGRGEVFLVGAGPGDPELLTLRAARLIETCNAVVHDHLVSDAILSMLPMRAERFYVGKQSGRHALSQDEINRLLLRLAGRGRRVLRLKGGDPFIFGRGGEEAEFLARHGVSCSVVPGITSASGAAAGTGIPLTHRSYSQSVVYVTGHRQGGDGESQQYNLDWDMLARPRQTVVIYMGLSGIRVICDQLIAHGLAADTPAAAIEKATLPGQRVLVSTLAGLPAEVGLKEFCTPTLFIVGQVVCLYGLSNGNVPVEGIAGIGISEPGSSPNRMYAVPVGMDCQESARQKMK
jgi:uroporphyrin-III C-methyltransferase